MADNMPYILFVFNHKGAIHIGNENFFYSVAPAKTQQTGIDGKCRKALLLLFLSNFVFFLSQKKFFTLTRIF
jgi:hypothetical protein